VSRAVHTDNAARELGVRQLIFDVEQRRRKGYSRGRAPQIDHKKSLSAVNLYLFTQRAEFPNRMNPQAVLDKFMFFGVQSSETIAAPGRRGSVGAADVLKFTVGKVATVQNVWSMDTQQNVRDGDKLYLLLRVAEHKQQSVADFERCGVLQDAERPQTWFWRFEPWVDRKDGPQLGPPQALLQPRMVFGRLNFCGSSVFIGTVTDANGAPRFAQGLAGVCRSAVFVEQDNCEHQGHMKELPQIDVLLRM